MADMSIGRFQRGVFQLTQPACWYAGKYKDACMSSSKNNGALSPAQISKIMPSAGPDISVDALARKVLEDIQFLQERIDRVSRLQTPNSAVLKTYQSMLESRQQVLAWLRENCELEDQPLSSTG